MMEKCHMMFSRLQQELESPPTANTWSYHRITPLCRVSATDLVRGFTVWGWKQKAGHSQSHSAASVLAEISFSSPWGQKDECHLTLTVQRSKMYSRQTCHLCPGNVVQGGTWICMSAEQRNIAGAWGVSQRQQSQIKMYPPLQFCTIFSPPAISFWHQFPLDFLFQGGSERSDLLSPFRCLQTNFLCFHLQMFQPVHKWQRFQETVGELYSGFQKLPHILQQYSSASLVESLEFIYFFSV